MAEEAVRRFNPTGLYDPTPYGYCHVSVAPAGSSLAFIAGQGGEDERGDLPADYEAQLKRAYANLLVALKTIRAGPEDVVKVTNLVVGHDDSKQKLLATEMRAIWGDRLPAETLIPVPKLARDGMLFEVDAVAVVRSTP